MKYIPQGPDDQKELLKAVGLKSTDELFQFIPSHLKIKNNLDYPKAQSEIEIRKTFQKICSAGPSPSLSFAGCGLYHHDIPSVIPFIQSRSEFSTSYTPYQPEISQGNLQAIFEFQTLITQLTECELSNASLYDGATSLAEGILMAMRLNKKSEGKIILSSALHPHYEQVVRTYCHAFLDRIVMAPLRGDRLDQEALAQLIQSDADILVTQSPNIFGVIEDDAAIGKLIKGSETFWVTSTTEPFVWGVTRGPGAFGAHIVTAEGQSFGAPPYLGGASYGIFATKQEYIRQLPGRLVGESLDQKGRRSYTLTFATREQFIRREKATSNICTNQNLNMLAGVIHMATLGKAGLKAVSTRLLSHAEYLKTELREISAVKISESPTFSEFCIDLPMNASLLVKKAADAGWVCGVDLGRFKSEWNKKLLVATSELHTRAELDRLIEFVRTSV